MLWIKKLTTRNICPLYRSYNLPLKKEPTKNPAARAVKTALMTLIGTDTCAARSGRTGPSEEPIRPNTVIDRMYPMERIQDAARDNRSRVRNLLLLLLSI